MELVKAHYLLYKSGKYHEYIKYLRDMKPILHLSHKAIPVHGWINKCLLEGARQVKKGSPWPGHYNMEFTKASEGRFSYCVVAQYSTHSI